MVISYLGGECFKVSQGDLTLSFNPPAKDSKLASAKFGADIALVSLHHDDFAGVENASFGEREPFIIDGPGEYEVKGVAVRGFGAPTTYDGGKTINTIYAVSFEGMNLVFMGAQSTGDLPATAVGAQHLDRDARSVPRLCDVGYYEKSRALPDVRDGLSPCTAASCTLCTAWGSPQERDFANRRGGGRCAR
jgi:hypothetical protein